MEIIKQSQCQKPTPFLQLQKEMRQKLERASRSGRSVHPPRAYPESGLQGVTYRKVGGHDLSYEEYVACHGFGDPNYENLRALRVDMRSGDYFARRGPLPRPAPPQEQPSSHRGPVVRGETAPRSSSRRRSVEGTQQQVSEQPGVQAIARRQRRCWGDWRRRPPGRRPSHPTFRTKGLHISAGLRRCPLALSAPKEKECLF